MHQASRKEYLGTKPCAPIIDQEQILIVLYGLVLRFISDAQKTLSSENQEARADVLRRAEKLIFAMANSLESRTLERNNTVEKIYERVIPNTQPQKDSHNIQISDSLFRQLSELIETKPEITQIEHQNMHADVQC